MDKLIELLIEKGVLFAIAVGLGGIVVWFVRRELKSYETRMGAVSSELKKARKEIVDAVEGTKAAIRTVISELQKEVSTAKFNVDSLATNIEIFKNEVKKESLGLKQQSSLVHERSEKLRTYIDQASNKIVSALEVKEKADQAYGKVILLEEKNEKQFAAVKELLKQVLSEKKT